MAGNPRGVFSLAAIRSLPQCVAQLCSEQPVGIAETVSLLLGARRAYLTGTGSSLHAAQLGEYLLRAAAVEAWAIPAFDFVQYPRPLASTDAVLVVSHRGNKHFSVAAVERAAAAQARTAIITGKPTRYAGPPPGALIETVEQERSSMHTVSLVASAIVLALIASGVAPASGVREDLAKLPSALIRALAVEEQTQLVARQSLTRRARLFFTGGGPCGVAAVEAALKVKEAAYLTAEGMSCEAFIHGPMMGVEPEDVVVILATEGPSLDRARDVLRALTEFGAGTWWVSNVPAGGSATWETVLPALREELWPLVALAPLDLFAYHIALLKGADPDGFRLDDERYRRGWQAVTF
ncbi:MAG: SIS domain-containing protein [Chloroflexi bacterium]|nr:SIS domain-containing protein [Chloroflexota bacterium]